MTAQKGSSSKFRSAEMKDQSARKFTLHFQQTLASNGASVLNGTIQLRANAAIDWGIISSYYDEYRLLGIRVKLVSLQQYSVSAGNSLMYVCFDNDDDTALTSNNQAMVYTDKAVMSAVFQHVGELPEVTFWRPVSTASPIPWIDVATPTSSLGAVKFYADSLSVSTNYVIASIEYFVEARGRR